MASRYASIRSMVSSTKSTKKNTGLKILGRALANQKKIISLLDDVKKGKSLINLTEGKQRWEPRSELLYGIP